LKGYSIIEIMIEYRERRSEMARVMDSELARRLAGHVLNTWAYGATLPTDDSVAQCSVELIERYEQYLLDTAHKLESILAEWVVANPPS